MEKKILVVNYQPQKLKEWKELLKDIGEDIIEAGNGEDALKLFNETNPYLVLIDPMLPRKSGFDVIKEIKEHHPETKVVVVASVHKGPKYQVLAKNTYHVDEFIEEPVEGDVLKEKVARVIGFSIDSSALEELMLGEKSSNEGERENTDKPKKKKGSAKRRFEEIIEETLSGKIIDDLPKKKVKKTKKTEGGEKIFTSEELFGDVISEVEESFTEEPFDNLIDDKIDSVEAVVEEKLEKTLSGLKIDKKKKKKTDKTEKKEDMVETEKIEQKTEPEKVEKKEVRKKEGKKKEKGVEYGNYLLLEKVATGGMAELFKAKRRGVQGFQKIVAIKRILPHLVENEDFVTMFIDEAKLAAQLNHPNIAQIYDLGKIEDTFYIAMEYVEGHDLRKILKKCKEKGCSIPEPIVLFVASKVLSALDYAHRKKGLDNKDLHIVHRDISPQNIILSVEGDVKLVDFGIAKAATKASQTQAGALKGKLLYMSPEQAWGEKVDKRSDLFSLGSVMYEALTGKKCFLAESEISILEKVRNVDYTPIRKVNPNVSKLTARIIEKALTKDPEKRYQSAKEMEQDILNILNSLPYTVNERTVAEFVNALYSDDSGKLSELARKLVVEDLEKNEVVAGVGVDKTDQEDFSISDEDIDSEDYEEIADRRANTGTVVVPNPEDLKKYEEEEMKKIEEEEKSNKKIVVIGAIVAIVIVAIIGYFISSKKSETKPVKKAEIAKKVEQSNQPESNQPEEKNGLNVSKQSANAGVTTEEKKQQVLNEIEKKKQKMVEELTKKKIEEQKKKMEAELAKQKRIIEEKRRKLAETKKKIENPPTKRVKSNKNRKVKAHKSGETVNKQQKKQIENKPVQVAQNTNESRNNVISQQKAKENTSTKEKQATKTEKPQNKKVNKVSNPEPQPEARKNVAIKKPAEPAKPEVKLGDLVPLTDDVVKPVPVKKVKPRLTLAARRMKVHGIIIAQALIDENGNVIEVRILRRMRRPFGLDKEVKKALEKWKFEPATKKGVRVKVYDTFVFKF